MAEEIFERRLGLKLEIGDGDSIPPNEDFLISYGMESRGWIIPESGVLNSGAMDEVKFNFENLDFQRLADHKGNRFTVDWLGLIFWFLSRQEEYQMKKKQDAHGRFSPYFSVLYKLDKFQFPWVDFWVERIRIQLEEEAILIPKKANPVEVSIDIDNMLAYKEKGFWRNLAGFGRDFLSFRIGEMARRISVLSGFSSDPFASIPEIESQLLPSHNPTFFIWIGNYGPFDKGLSFENPYFRKTVKLLSEKYRVGLHPSYAVFSEPGLLKKEKERLEDISKMRMVHNRFHFLRFRLPESYRLLISNGLEHDYSMGFSEIQGYRAGTGIPFYWYDLEREEKTKLLVHPFALMDSTARHKLNWKAEKFLESYQNMKTDAAKVSGKLHILIHNEFCAWKGWEKMLQNLK